MLTIPPGRIAEGTLVKFAVAGHLAPPDPTPDPNNNKYPRNLLLLSCPVRIKSKTYSPDVQPRGNLFHINEGQRRTNSVQDLVRVRRRREDTKHQQ